METLNSQSPTHHKLDKWSCDVIVNFYHSVHGNHFSLDRKILETIWSSGLFRGPKDTMVTSLKDQLIFYQGCVFGANYATLCVADITLLEVVSPLLDSLLNP